MCGTASFWQVKELITDAISWDPCDYSALVWMSAECHLISNQRLFWSHFHIWWSRINIIAINAQFDRSISPDSTLTDMFGRKHGCLINTNACEALFLCRGFLFSVVCRRLALAISLSGVSLITHTNTDPSRCAHGRTECACEITADHQQRHRCVIYKASCMLKFALTFSSAQSFSSAMFIRRQNTRAALTAARGKSPK